MYFALFISLILLSMLFSAGWVWLCMGLIRQGSRRAFGLIAVQLSIIFFFYSVLRADVLGAIFGWLLAPIFILRWAELIAQYSSFISLFILVPVFLGAITAVLSLAVKPLRLWSGTVGVLVVLFTAVYFGEEASESVMCATARDMGASRIYRNSFLWSLQNAPVEFQWEVHAMAETGDRRWAWSYKELGWYSLNDEVNAEVNGPLIDCPANGSGSD